MLDELRTIIRTLCRQPGFALGAIATLALGLGVNAAMFSFLDRVLLRPPAGLRAPSALRRLWIIEHDRGTEHAYQYFDSDFLPSLTSALDGRAQIALYAKQPYVWLTVGATATQVDVVRADPSYFSLLGAAPAHGRLFGRDEAWPNAAAPVVVISDDYWTSYFGRDSAAIGRRLVLAGEPFTIIGVMQPGFHGADLSRVDLWIPLSATPIGFGGGATRAGGGGFRAGALMRLRDGATDDAVESRASSVIRRLETEAGDDTLARAVISSIIEMRGPGRQSQEVVIAARLGGVALIVLLIAFANVVNLLLARAVARRRELAIRLALGTSRGGVVRLLSTESALLAAAAGIVAAASAQVTGSLLRSQLLPETAFADPVLHWRVVVLTIGVAIVAGVIAGGVPAFEASRPNLTQALKAGSHAGMVQRSLLRSTLVASQAGLSVVLLVGAGLFVQSLRGIESIPIGYDLPSLATAEVWFDSFDRSPDHASLLAAADRIRGVPGIQSVALTPSPPLGGSLVIQFYTATDSGSPDWQRRPSFVPAAADYFKTTGIRIVRGRDFASPSEHAVIVNQTMARKLWPNGDALGQCIRLHKPTNPCSYVVGIASDAHRRKVIEESFPQFYVPLEQAPKGMDNGSILIRTTPPRMSAVLAAARQILKDVIPGGHPVVHPVADDIAADYRPWRLAAGLFSVFGLLALIVATVGIYSSVSYTVTQRTHELGVRIALGARMRDVLSDVVTRSMRPVAVGIACGICAALAGGKFVQSLLYDVSATNPAIIAGVACLLSIVAISAALAPGMRAASVDPAISLRAD